jgi:2-dehydro-3-deoxygluconokinase
MSESVLCLGEAMVTLRSEGRLRLGDPMVASIAGAESNVAIGLARLGHDVAWAGQVGSDELGELVLRTLRAEGVDVRTRRDPARPTGLMFREQRTGDIIHVEYVRRGSAGSALDVALIEEALDPAPAHLHVSGVTPALSEANAKAAGAALRRARELGAVTSLDLNYRSRLWSRDEAASALRAMLPDVDVLFASANELPLVFDTEPPGDRVTELVVTHGADGAEAWESGRQARVAARPVRAIDPVGAGDAFVAGYLSARLDGRDLDGRLARGTDVAAVAVGSAGDWEGLPTRTELAAFAGDHGGMLR